jgi:hypothetical protein
LLGAFGPVLVLPLLLEFEDGELEVSSKFERFWAMMPKIDVLFSGLSTEINITYT